MKIDVDERFINEFRECMVLASHVGSLLTNHDMDGNIVPFEATAVRLEGDSTDKCQSLTVTGTTPQFQTMGEHSVYVSNFRDLAQKAMDVLIAFNQKLYAEEE